MSSNLCKPISNINYIKGSKYNVSKYHMKSKLFTYD